MPKWLTVKDAIQLIFWVIAITLFLGGLKASNALNAATLAALKEIQVEQGTDIKYLLLKDAEEKGYEKAKRELDTSG